MGRKVTKKKPYLTAHRLSRKKAFFLRREARKAAKLYDSKSAEHVGTCTDSSTSVGLVTDKTEAEGSTPYMQQCLESASYKDEPDITAMFEHNVEFSKDESTEHVGTCTDSSTSVGLLTDNTEPEGSTPEMQQCLESASNKDETYVTALLH